MGQPPADECRARVAEIAIDESQAFALADQRDETAIKNFNQRTRPRFWPCRLFGIEPVKSCCLHAWRKFATWFAIHDRVEQHIDCIVEPIPVRAAGGFGPGPNAKALTRRRRAVRTLSAAPGRNSDR